MLYLSLWIILSIVAQRSLAIPPGNRQRPSNLVPKDGIRLHQPSDPKRQHFLLGAARFGMPSKYGIEFCDNYIYSFDTRAQHPIWILEHLTSKTVGRRIYLCDLSPGFGLGFSYNRLITDQSMCSSNVFPQLPAVNRGPWMRLEKYVAHVAMLSENIHIVTGSLYSPLFRFGTFSDTSHEFSTNRLGPTYFYKVFVSESFLGEFSMEAFFMPFSLNNNGHIDLNEFRVDIQQGVLEIEKATGLVFFPKLDRSKITKPRDLQYGFVGRLDAHQDFIFEPAVTRSYLHTQLDTTKPLQSFGEQSSNRINTSNQSSLIGGRGKSSSGSRPNEVNNQKFVNKRNGNKQPPQTYVRKQPPVDNQCKNHKVSGQREPARPISDSSSTSSTSGSKEKIVWKSKVEESVNRQNTESVVANTSDVQAEVESEINSIIKAMEGLDLDSNDPAVSEKSREFVSHAARFGLPSDDNLRMYEDLVLSYDRRLKHPIWMLEHLNINQRQVRCADRKMGLFSAANGTYNNAEFPGNTARFGGLSFCLTNVAPQALEFYQGPWSKLETYIDELARISKNMYVVTGALYQSDQGRGGLKAINYNVIGDNEVGVPTHLYKVWVRENNNGRLSMEAFKVPNSNMHHLVDWMQYRIDIDKDLPAIERSTGLVFFGKLDRTRVIKISPKSV